MSFVYFYLETSIVMTGIIRCPLFLYEDKIYFSTEGLGKLALTFFKSDFEKNHSICDLVEFCKRDDLPVKPLPKAALLKLASSSSLPALKSQDSKEIKDITNSSLNGAINHQSYYKNCNREEAEHYLKNSEEEPF